MIRRKHWLIGAVLLGLAVFGPGAVTWVELTLRTRRLDRRLAEVAAEEERLKQEQQRLESDPAYVEGLIRSTFKLAQPGEYVIPLEADPSSAPSR